jgi:hypothetical protein
MWWRYWQASSLPPQRPRFSFTALSGAGYAVSSTLMRRRTPSGAGFTSFGSSSTPPTNKGRHFHAWDISRNAPKANVAAGNRRLVDGFWDLIRFRLDTPRPGDARRDLPFRKQSYARRHRGRFSGSHKRSSHVIGERLKICALHDASICPRSPRIGRRWTVRQCPRGRDLYFKMTALKVEGCRWRRGSRQAAEPS